MKSREDLRGLTPEELQGRLESAYEEFENLNLQKATHQISNPLRIRSLRRDIARLKTLLHQHKLGIAVNVKESEK
jgi:large subunit ribosomal protein L29